MHRFFYSVVLMALIAAVGCGPKPIAEESVLDTTGNHLNRGMRALDQGNLSVATEALTRSLALDPDNSTAIAAIGLVHALQGDFKTARDKAEDAAFKDDKNADVHLLIGRIITEEHTGSDKNDWVKEAVKSFDKAIALNPRSSAAYYHKGIAYERSLDFTHAETAYSKVIALKNSMEPEANVRYARIQDIQRAAPGTRVGARVALLDQIDRGEFAVLLMEELKLADVLAKRGKKRYDTDFKTPQQVDNPSTSAHASGASDIAEHWAKTWINDVIAARLTGLEAGPDGKFHPNESVTRAEFAMVMQNIVILANGDPTIKTRYIGQESRFPDVKSSHFAYNAMALMTERGVLKTDLINGEFRPSGPISGAHALLAIRQFQNEFKMTF